MLGAVGEQLECWTVDWSKQGLSPGPHRILMQVVSIFYGGPYPMSQNMDLP